MALVPSTQVLVRGGEEGVVPMEITFMDNGGNIFVLDEFIEQMNSYMILYIGIYH